MPEQIPFKLKLLMTLYGFGLKNFAGELLQGLPRRGTTWTEFVLGLFQNTDDLAARKLALGQLTAKGFLQKHPSRAQFLELIASLLSGGIGDERNVSVRFIGENLELFPKDTDAFQMQVIGLQRAGDPKLATAADELLEKMGLDMRDPELFRQGR